MSEGTERLPLLPDVLAYGLNLVFCGTALGRISWEKKCYYGNRGNLFWPTLTRLGFVPPDFAREQFASLPQYGLGLTDVAKYHWGQDDALPQEALGTDAAAALKAKILTFQPRHLAFTSRTAAQAVLGKLSHSGRTAHRIGATEVWVLPSPSGLARRWWRDEPWQELAQAVS